MIREGYTAVNEISKGYTVKLFNKGAMKLFKIQSNRT